MRAIRKLGALGTLTLLTALFVLTPIQPAAAQVGGATVVYNIYATDGYMNMPDGQQVYVYGFIGGRSTLPLTYYDALTQTAIPYVDPVTNLPAPAPDPTGGPITAAEAPLAGHAQVPAPVIWAAAGDVVEIRLKNLGVAANPDAPNDPHSIHLHGLDVDAANDGVPETSIGAVPATLTDPITGVAVPGAGNVIVYMFTTLNPGTYIYHCHQEADIHVQMGMYGALVIYNAGEPAALTGPGMGQGGKMHGFAYDKDYVIMLSEFDVRQHEAEAGTFQPPAWNPEYEYNPVDFDPQYWMINGLAFPNTIHGDTPGVFSWANWIQAYRHYDPFVTGSVSAPNLTWGTPGQKILLRMINIGFEAQPMHMHGFHAKVLGSDQRAWGWANKSGGKNTTPFGAGLEKNTILIGSGETYELLIDFGQQALAGQYAGAAAPGPISTFPGGTESRYDPVTGQLLGNENLAGSPIPDPMSDPLAPVYYVPGPWVNGDAGPATGQYFPFHNHDDYKATNNGAYPGGMFTMFMTLP